LIGRFDRTGAESTIYNFKIYYESVNIMRVMVT
jgi:hypothetical protein